MEIFINIVQTISDSRHWLGPLLVICVFAMLVNEIISTVQDEIEEIRGQKSEARDRKGTEVRDRTSDN